jgi:segregation and condensation protein B
MSDHDSNPEKKSTLPQSKESQVAMVDDPFGINTLEISEAQNSTDELTDLDNDLDDYPNELDADEDEGELQLAEEDPILMSDLAKAVAQSDAEHADEVAHAMSEGLSEEQAAAELARQIAEDQALAEQMAKESEDDEADPELQAALPNSEHLDLLEVQSCIESLLFMADKPISAEKLRDLLGPSFTLNVFQEAITALQDRYKANHHGFELMEVAGGYQLRTKPNRAPLARKLAKIQTQRLSSGGMECLAIVAYKQPVLKEDIDKIRGVDSSYFIRGLMDKKLIKISGRSELPGRPMLYSTTDEFLQIFGLKDLSSLPPLRELENMVPASTAKHEDDPRVKEMRRLVGQMNTDTSVTLKYDPKEDDKLLQEIRERVQSIPSSTPYLDEQKAMEQAEAATLKAAKAQAAEEAKRLAELGELGAAMIADTLSEADLQPGNS